MFLTQSFKLFAYSFKHKKDMFCYIQLYSFSSTVFHQKPETMFFQISTFCSKNIFSLTSTFWSLGWLQVKISRFFMRRNFNFFIIFYSQKLMFNRKQYYCKSDFIIPELLKKQQHACYIFLILWIYTYCWFQKTQFLSFFIFYIFVYIVWSWVCFPGSFTVRQQPVIHSVKLFMCFRLIYLSDNTFSIRIVFQKNDYIVFARR